MATKMGMITGMIMEMETDIDLVKIRYSRYTLLILIIVLLGFVSCKNDTFEEITGPVGDVSFMADIQPIFNGTCGGAGCHLETSQSGVNLSSYDQLMNSIGHQYQQEIVHPGEPESSPLVDKIEPAPQHGVRMPFARDPLSDRQIQEIRVWIEEGAMNN